MADYSSGEILSTTPSGAFGGVSVDNIRRTFGIGDKVSELAPETSIFFSYLSKLGKKPTDETVWKPLEYRNQWQRRNFKVSWQKLGGPSGADGAAITSVADAGASDGTHFIIWTDYDHTGKQTKSDVLPDAASFVGYAPIFLTKNQIVRFDGVAYKLTADPQYYTYTDADTAAASTKAAAGKAVGYCTIDFANVVVVSTGSATTASFNNGTWDKQGQVIGSQWGEATGAPEGWRDELSAVEFYTQIFKTSVPLMSGSMQATRYRGYANEWKRIYAEHLKSHKMDLENAFLFGYGKYTDADTRNSWGVVPFIENKGGKRYQFDYDAATAASSDSTYDVKAGFCYDGMVDVMDDFMNWEGGNSGQKLCLTSRKVINSLHKMGAGNFLDNSFHSSDVKTVFSANLETKTSSFMPIDITSISTSWGSMNFVAHPLFRGDMEDKAVCVDLANVSYRPLSGNGISRDTFVETNVQENDIDGRKDMIITEAGLEIMLPETHATIDFV
jgi:hypothetical protein